MSIFDMDEGDQKQFGLRFVLELPVALLPGPIGQTNYHTDADTEETPKEILSLHINVQTRKQ